MSKLPNRKKRNNSNIIRYGRKSIEKNDYKETVTNFSISYKSTLTICVSAIFLTVIIQSPSSADTIVTAVDNFLSKAWDIRPTISFDK